MINGFTLHDTTTAPAASAEILNGVQKACGFVPNLHRVLAESPAEQRAALTLCQSLPYTRILPSRGRPGGRELYEPMRYHIDGSRPG